MMRRKDTFDGAFGASLFTSTAIHLAVFLLLIWWGKVFPVTTHVQETYYVDVVNLPVASPRSGSPTQQGNGAEAPAPAVPEKTTALPTPKKPEPHVKKQATPKSSVKEQAAESDSVAKKIAKLRSKTEAQQQEATMERLRRKVASSGTGRSGMPGAGGNEAGSRYEDYLKSRLEDALAKTSNYSTSKPVVVVRLTIGANGQITRKKTENSSGDHAFEIAVQRAIDIVSESLAPPPGHTTFEGGFIFKPQGITNKH